MKAYIEEQLYNVRELKTIDEQVNGTGVNIFISVLIIEPH